MLQIDVSRGEKVILPQKNCTGGRVFRGSIGRIGPISSIGPISFYSQLRALFDGGLFDKRRHRFLRRWITIEFAVCREASFRPSSALSKCVDHSARIK